MNKSFHRVSIHPLHLLKQILVLLSLAIWLAATNHCYLETGGVLPADDCSETQPTSAGDPCDTGCKLVEKAGYKTEDNQGFTPLLVRWPMVLQVLPALTPAPSKAFSPMNWWPEAFHLPQFVIQTALPIRAPAFVA